MSKQRDVNRNAVIQSVQKHAEEFGWNPTDLLTAISYETGGTFDPWQRGPTTKWGQHRGLIQWGEPQQAKYGVRQDSSVDEQVRAIGSYLRDAGFKPGMRLPEIYSAINAGRVGRYNVTDEHVGGAPGTVMDKINSKQMAQHRANVEAAQETLSFPLGTVTELTQATSANIPDATTEAVMNVKRNEAIENGEDLSFTSGLTEGVKTAWEIDPDSFMNRMFGHDPDWKDKLTPERLQSAVDAGYPEDRLWELTDTVNEQHFNKKIETVQSDKKYLDKLSMMGWKGTAAGIGAAILSPETAAAIAASAVTEGALGSVMLPSVVSRAALIARSATIGGLGSVAGDYIAAKTFDREYGADDALVSAGLGIAVGGFLGGLRKHTATQAELDTFHRAGNNVVSSILRDAEEEGAEAAVRQFDETITPQRQSTGGAQAGPRTEFGILDKDPFYHQADVPKAPFSKFRFSVTGQLGGSDNPLVRNLTPSLMPESVGKADGGVREISAWERMKVTETQWRNEIHSSLEKGYLEHAVANKQAVSELRAYGSDYKRQITEYVRMKEYDPLEAAKFPDSVKKVGDVWSKVVNDMRLQQQNPRRNSGGFAYPVSGSEGLGPNASYIHRQWAGDRLISQLHKFGDDTTVDFFTNAFLDGNPHYVLPAQLATARKIAKGVIYGVRARSLGITSPYQKFLGGQSIDDMVESLRGMSDDLIAAGKPDLALTADEIAEFAAEAGRKQGAAGASSPMKRRVSFSENYKAMMPDKYGEMHLVKFSDFLENDFEELAAKGIRNAAANVALGAIKVVHPATGEVLVDGIQNSAQWDTLMDVVRRVGADAREQMGLPVEKIAQANLEDVKRLQYSYDMIRGVPQGSVGSTGDALLNRLRQLQHTRVMNQSGLASLFEIAGAVASLGTKAVLARVPEVTRGYMRKIIKGDFGSADMRELEALTGLGYERTLGASQFRHGEAVDVTETLGDKMHSTLDRALGTGVKITNWASGLKPITEWSQGVVGTAAMHVLHDMATKGSKGLSEVEMRWMGWSKSDADGIMERIRKYGGTTKGVTEAETPTLNVSAWTETNEDLYFRDKVIMGVNALTNRIIQNTDPGAQPMWMSGQLGRTFMQFKSFMVQAYEKQLLHNINAFNQGDKSRAFGYFMITSLGGIATHLVRSHVVAAGRQDREEYLEKELTTQKIALATIGRSSWGSLIPGVVDTSIGAFGFDPLFSYRTTGASNNFISFDANPTTDNLNRVYDAIGGITSPIIEGREISKKEARALIGSLPFQNMLPIAWSMQALIEDLPDRPPRKD